MIRWGSVIRNILTSRTAAFVLAAPYLLSATIALAEPDPENAGKPIHKSTIAAENIMAVTANPLATQAAFDIIQQGGCALDAAIAAQLVLSVVEPQSSGIGGGGFMLYYDGKTKALQSFDGRETAPGSARGNRFQHADGTSMEFYEAAKSGLSVGVPGLLNMLYTAQQKHGRLPWDKLFARAIYLAYNGFPISPRLAMLIKEGMQQNPDASFKALYLHADGTPKQEGETLVNPALAETFRNLANGGIEPFYKGSIAQDIVHALEARSASNGAKASDSKSSGLKMEDFAAYSAHEREPVCGPYRGYKICSMGPPSSGGIAILQVLGMLEGRDLSSYAPYDPNALHLILEAEKLAFADREQYVGDPEFVEVPVEKLLSRDYLLSRATKINPDRASGKAQAGSFTQLAYGRDHSYDGPSTTHMSIRDKDGDIVSLTTSIEHAFGAGIVVDGMLLNNQLTDFSFEPFENGHPVANRVEPRKRPRSSMSPVIVFDAKGEPWLVIGSPGGSSIIPYVIKTLINVIDWKMSLQEAIAAPHYMNKNDKTILEAGSGAEKLAVSLRAMGHEVTIEPESSGLHGFMRNAKDGKFYSGVDPRREGRALGE